MYNSALLSPLQQGDHGIILEWSERYMTPSKYNYFIMIIMEIPSDLPFCITIRYGWLLQHRQLQIVMVPPRLGDHDGELVLKFTRSVDKS